MNFKFIQKSSSKQNLASPQFYRHSIQDNKLLLIATSAPPQHSIVPEQSRFTTENTENFANSITEMKIGWGAQTPHPIFIFWLADNPSAAPPHFAVGITNSAPLPMLAGQRCMIDFCLV